jgi:hypothetical protein
MSSISVRTDDANAVGEEPGVLRIVMADLDDLLHLAEIQAGLGQTGVDDPVAVFLVLDIDVVELLRNLTATLVNSPFGTLLGCRTLLSTRFGRLLGRPSYSE